MDAPIGTLRHGLGINQAAMFYTTLTIGKGIVSQVPALIVSLGAGLLVSKGSGRGSADRAFVSQLSSQSKPLFLAAGMAVSRDCHPDGDHRGIEPYTAGAATEGQRGSPSCAHPAQQGPRPGLGQRPG